MIEIKNVCKTFTLHNQGGAKIPVLDNVNCSVNSGEALILYGKSGKGKSTLLRSLYGNYLLDEGSINITFGKETFDLTKLSSREIIQLRQNVIGWVSQFLRVIPRVSTIDLVMRPLLKNGVDEAEARARGESLLKRLNIPQNLWNLSPSTFSGGEQQRVNIACGFIMHYPILLLDEPTASLDQTNKAIVVELIKEAKDRGSIIVGIFHDEEVRDIISDVILKM